MYRSFWTLLAAIAVIGCQGALAGITGTISGTVTDEDGQPMQYARVQVLGLKNVGKITSKDGSYTILNVPTGTWDVKTTANPGYDTVTKVITVSADDILELDFQLHPGGSATTIHVVTNMIDKYKIGSEYKLSDEELNKVGVNTVVEILNFKPNFSLVGTGYVSRGERPSGSQYQIDGLNMSDLTTGGNGNTSLDVTASIPSSLATSGMEYKPGGAGAEVSNVTGAIVKQQIKTGRSDRYSAQLRWRKDVPFLYGYANNGVQAGAPYEDVVDATIDGPIGINSSTFFLALRNTYQNYRNAGIQVYDPSQNNLGQLPNNRTWSRNLTGRLKFHLGQGLTFLVGGMYGVVSGERSNWNWLYADEQGARVDNNGIPIRNPDGSMQLNGVPARNAQQVVVQEFSTNGFGQLQYVGSDTSASAYDVRFSFNSKTTETGKRRSFDAPDIIAGLDLWYPEDNLGLDATTYVAGANQILDAYDYARAAAVTMDGRASVEVTLRNPLTGYVEGPPDAQATSNPYGLLGYFVARGNEGGVDFRNTRYFQADGNYMTRLAVGTTTHHIKAGFEFRQIRLTRHYNANPWDGAPFYDVYGSDYGGNLYYSDLFKSNVEAKTASEQPYFPITGGVYVQDQIVFDGLVFTPGIRLDYLNADATYRTNFDYFTPFGNASGFANAPAKLYVSPRINITYPVNEEGTRTFALSYGVYYAPPPFGDFYDSFNAFQLRGGQVLGNPNMEMQRSNQYQVEYNHQVGSDMAFTITGYYKDMYNQSGIAYVRAVPLPYYQRVLADYGSSKGLELTFEKRTKDNWGLSVNYTLASASGTANDNATAPGIDPYTGEAVFPATPNPLSFDRRHRINAIVNLAWGKDEGPALFGTRILQNFSLNVATFWQTGLPYTPVNSSGQATGGANSGRFPSNWNSTLRLVRTVDLSGIFGNKSEMDFFVDVENIFDFTNAIFFYPRTGNPDLDGAALNRQLSDFPADTYFRQADAANPETYNIAQYDRMGQRKYNAAVDANSDGRVTPQESYAGYQRYVSTVVARQTNYQYPRQVFAGVTFRF